jgi:hypothetical protein
MEVRELFRQDASENGKDPATYEKYLGRLKEEMIDTLADLKRLTPADWVRLEIPIGLVNRIKEMICDKKPTPIKRVNPEFTPVVSRRAIWHALYTIGRDYDQFFTEDQAIRLLVCNHEYPADSTLDPRLPP